MIVRIQKHGIAIFAYKMSKSPYPMKRKSGIWGLGMALFAFLLLTASPTKAQDTGRSWALKAGMGGIFTGHISGEVEVFLKGRVSIAVRGALIHPNIDSLRGPAEGFFFKVGPKFYLSKERASGLGGFALKPELLFGHLRDWKTNLWGNYGNRWVNTFGVLCNLSYNLRIGDSFFLEPSLGAGYVGGVETYVGVDDSPPYAAFKETLRIDRFSNVLYNHSYISPVSGIALSGGVMVGVKF
jgi:hypothetical protein